MAVKFLLLVVGGAVGTLARYSLVGFTHRYYEGPFPLGTLVVNLLGCLIIGLLWGLTEMTEISGMLRTFLFVGILGGFTTFSTLALESMSLIRAGEIGWGILC